MSGCCSYSEKDIESDSLIERVTCLRSCTVPPHMELSPHWRPLLWRGMLEPRGQENRSRMPPLWSRTWTARSCSCKGTSRQNAESSDGEFYTHRHTQVKHRLDDLLLTEGLQVSQPAGLVQVMLRVSFDGSSFWLLDHKEQQHHSDRPQCWSDLKEEQKEKQRSQILQEDQNTTC